MNKGQIGKATIELYTEFFRQVTYNKDFTFRKLPKDLKIISRFCDWMLKKYKPEQIGIDFLIEFFKFQFSRYAGKQTQYGMNVIMIHWLIGDKAQKAWDEQKYSKKWIVKVKLRKNVEIRLLEAFKSQIKIAKKQNNKQSYLKVHQHEETAKKRFFNLKKGFLYCHGTTTLHNPKSDFCNRCNFKQECIISLKAQFPNLYKLRMDNE